jgi:hypothetical protein
MGGGVPSKTVDYDYITNIQKSMKGNDVGSLTSLADNLAGMRGGKFTYESVKPYTRPDGTITGVEFILKDEYGEPASRILKSDASNLKAQLVGLYQDIAGSSTKAEKSLAGEKPKPAPKPTLGKPVLYILNGKKYNIPSDEVAEFLKDNPKAKKG